MPLDCSRANVFILSSRIEEVYPGGLDSFRSDWPTRAEDEALIRLSPDRKIDPLGLQSRLRDRGLEVGRDYALTDSTGRPERSSEGIVFERTMDIAAQEVVWRARAGTQASNITAFPSIERRSASLLRGPEYAPTVPLREEDSGEERLNLSVCVNPEGRLVFQGLECSRNDVGSGSGAARWSCRTVRPEHVPRVLVELMADRFECEETFTDWLKEKGIDSELLRGEI